MRALIARSSNFDSSGFLVALAVTTYEVYWRELFKPLKDYETTFAENFEKKRDCITSLDDLKPKGINWENLLPPPPQLTEEDRKVCGKDHVRRLGGLENILGERTLIRDITPDGQVRLPIHNLCLEELLQALGTRTITEQYSHDRERPSWEGVLGHVIDQGPPRLQKAGIFGDRMLSPSSNLGGDGLKSSTLTEFCKEYLAEPRAFKSATLPEMSVGWGVYPIEKDVEDGASNLLRQFTMPTMKDLEDMQNLMAPP